MIRIDTGNMSSSLGKSGGGAEIFFIYTKFYSQRVKGLGSRHTRMKILTVFRLDSGWTKAYSGLMLDAL